MSLRPFATIATPRKPLPVSRRRYKLTETWKYAELRRGVASNCETGSRPAILATDAMPLPHVGRDVPTIAITVTRGNSLPVFTSSEQCQFSVTPALNGGCTVRVAQRGNTPNFYRGVASLSQTGSRPTRATDATCRQGYVSPIAITATCRKALPVSTYPVKVAS